VSGDRVLDNLVVAQHDLYKGTGSIEAQARIDQYIIPCMVVQGFGFPFSGNSLRDRIPGSMWVQMTSATDIEVSC
jgi:hypothetical protein